MKKKLLLSLLLAVTTVTLGAGLTFAAHPDIQLYTYEEVGMQMGGLTKAQARTMPDGIGMMPVYINASGVGLPYSPKMTCGNCHNGTTTRWDGGPDLAAPLVSYNEMTTQAFHSELGAQEWQDTPIGKNGDGTISQSSQPGKPWSQTNGMWGKW